MMIETAAAPLTVEALEQMEAGSAMDALVAERFGLPLAPPCPARHNTDDAQYDSQLGWGGWCYTCGKSIDEVTPEAAPYSTSIGHAWQLIELCYATIPRESARWMAFVRARPVYPFHMKGVDLSIAICRAALLATIED